MASPATFKQQCPSCEAMITVKETMIGKKIECTKCKDKFIAERPEEDEDDLDIEIEVEEEPKSKKKETKVAAKKGGPSKTAVTSKTPPPAAKRSKLAVEDDEEEEEDETDDDADELEDEEVQVKPGKPKAGANGKAKPKAKDKDEDEEGNEDEDADESPKKKKAGGSNKMVIGLSLAGVGVVILIVAGWMLLGPQKTRNQPPPPPFKPGDQAKVDENPNPIPQLPKVPIKDPDPVATPLTDAELAKLSNLLPNDTEHVFRVAFRDMFAAGSTLRTAIFETPGGLDDAALRKNLGFSMLAIDDFILAEKNTYPGWRFTVLHFKDLLSEAELKTALKLESAGPAVEGQAYFKLTKANPTFDQLARFSFGIPNFFRYFEMPSADRTSYVRLHNPQTLIVADKAPMTAFLKVKGVFPLQTPRQPTNPEPKNPPPGGIDPNPPPMPPDEKKDIKLMPPMGGRADGRSLPPRFHFTEFVDPKDERFVQFTPVPIDGPAAIIKATEHHRMSLRNTTWEGTEDGMKIRVAFGPTNTITVDSDKHGVQGVKGIWSIFAVPAPGSTDFKDLQFKVLLQPEKIFGVYPLIYSPAGLVGQCEGKGKWDVSLQFAGGAQPPPPDGGTKVQPPDGGTKVQPPDGGTKVQPPVDPKDPNPKDPNPKDPNPKDPNPKDPPPPNPNAGREEMYLTVKPSLKAMLDRMETKGSDRDAILFSSATDMDANTIDPKDTGIRDMVIRFPRQVWDVTILLPERKPRIRFLGTALVRRDVLKYQLRNEILCAQEIDAQEFKQELMERTTFQIAKFFNQLVKHDVKTPSAVPKPDQPTPPEQPPGGDPEKKNDGKKPEPIFSQMRVDQKANTIEFTLDLLLDNSTLTQAREISTFAAASVRGEIEAAASQSLRHTLANAGKLLGEKGLSNRQVPAGTFPPGVFPRPNARSYTDKEPRNRISWMAGLLPYMGHGGLYDKINFNQTWRDPSNWLAGHASVPQFLDPRYPDFTRQLSIGDLPVDYGTTHFVGIAGVGLDAASYRRNDPATAHKRGILSYDGSASLAEIQEGRGAGNTILMIQIPYDQGTGVSPWIAGGGATLRGVPEKNSIAPFILGKDRNDKVIQYEAQKGAATKGTYALMADGTVRFIGENISDEVFKAMCTLGGPAPADFDLKANPNTPLVPAPTAPVQDPKKSPAKTPPVEKKPTPPKEEIKATPPVIAPAPGDDLKALQGVWSASSVEVSGASAPPAMVGAFRLTFKGDRAFLRISPEREDEHTFVIDAAQSPKHLTLTKVGGSLPPALCIYDLKGGELRVCLQVASGTVRPTDFTTQPNSGRTVAVLRKQ